MRVARELKERGVKVGGIVSRELKTNNTRIGFLPQMIEMFWDLSLETVLRLENISLTLQGAGSTDECSKEF